MLHIVDRCFWMLPFAALSDLETAANRAKYLADMRVTFLLELEREHSAPAEDEIPSARDQRVAMWKTWINTNTSRVCHCCGGKAGRVEDGGLPGPSGSAATLPLTT